MKELGVECRRILMRKTRGLARYTQRYISKGKIRMALHTFRDPNGKRYVLYLNRNSARWNWNVNWLENVWNRSNPSAVLASPHFSPIRIGEFSFMEQKLTIYTDGAARGNPGPAGWAAVVLHTQNSGEPRVVEIGGRAEHATNNQMELQAAIEALKYVRMSRLNLDMGEGAQVRIFADSKYVVQGITEWIFNWQKNGWRSASKKPVMNQELWQELFALTQGLDLKWDYVEGHADNKWNNRADEIATSFADNTPINLSN